MNVLNILENMGFKITWKLISLGLYGFEGVPVFLSRNELFVYLNDCLGRNVTQIDNIIYLLCEKEDNFKIDQLLSSLATEDGSIETVQLRKWKAYILKDLLNSYNQDYFQCMLELLEFWTSVGDMEKCPFDFPDKNSVQNYFTQAQYQIILEKNLAWLNNEVQSIIELELDLNGL